MIDKREKNAEIFRNTEQLYKSDKALISSIKASKARQKFTAEGEIVNIPENSSSENTKVTVSEKRSLEASEYYARQGKKVCVLNFASATNPGGGVTRGSSAQEESICRCTTLYPCLNSSEMWGLFYSPHRTASNPLYNNDCIYTPDITVFKSDISFPELLPREKWWTVDIITCAAPNLRPKPSNAMNPHAGTSPANITGAKLEKLLSARIKRIFEIAAANGNDVLILGAFGCGAFMNPPEIVARVFHSVMRNYIGYFDAIEYAVYHTDRDAANYKAFFKEMR